MGWFVFFQFLGLVALLALIFGYCRFKQYKFFSFIWQHFKWVALCECIVIGIVTVLCWNPLYHTTQCYFRGKSMKAETKYSWYLGECQVKTKSGSYVPIKRTRGLPDGGEMDDYQDNLY